MSSRHTELIDEVSEICVIKVHVFMDIGKIEGWSIIGQRGWRIGATKDVAVGKIEVIEEPTTKRTFSMNERSWRGTLILFICCVF